MKFKVSGILMYDRLMGVSKMLSRVSKSSITSNVRFSLYFDHIRIQAMNDSVSYTEDFFDVYTDIPCDQSFSFLIDAGTLFSFFKEHRCHVDVEVKNDNSIIFTYERGSFSSTWTDDKIFPAFSYPDKTDFSISSSHFVPEVKKSFEFIGEGEFKPAICMIYLNIKSDYIEMVSTDLFSMFINRNMYETGLGDGDKRGVMLSEGAAGMLYLLASEKDVDIRVSDDGIRTFLCFDNIVLSDMNIEAKYPDYERICNSFSPDSIIKVNRADMLSAVNSMSIAESHVCVELKGSTLVISSENKGYRKKVVENIGCDIVKGDGFILYMKKDCLLSTVKTTEGKHMVICWDNTHKIVKTHGSDSELTYVLNQTLRNF